MGKAWRHWVGLKSSSDFYWTFQVGASFVDLFFLMFYVCLYFTVLSVPCSLVITCWERADLLAIFSAMFSCVLTRSHTVSRVWCDTWLYRCLIFVFFFTIKIYALDSVVFKKNIKRSSARMQASGRILCIIIEKQTNHLTNKENGTKHTVSLELKQKQQLSYSGPSKHQPTA